jgi:hypothetical protein
VFRSGLPPAAFAFAPGSADLTAEATQSVGPAVLRAVRAVANWRAQGAVALPRIVLEVWGGDALARERRALCTQRLRSLVERYLASMGVRGIDLHALVPDADIAVGPVPAEIPGASALHPADLMVLRLDEAGALNDPRNTPDAMDAARADYPKRMPADLAGLRARLADPATPQAQRLSVLAVLPHPQRRWLATDESLLDALQTHVPAQEFAALAARMLVDVPQGARDAGLLRTRLELAATAVLQDPAVARAVLLDGWRLVGVPAGRETERLRHARAHLAAGTAYEGQLDMVAEHPRVVYVGEDAMTGGQVEGADAEPAVRLLARVVRGVLVRSELGPVARAFSDVHAYQTTLRRHRGGRPVVLPPLWPDGPAYGLDERAPDGMTYPNRSSTTEEAFFTALVSAWLGTNGGTDQATGLPRNNGSQWVREAMPADVVDLLERLFGDDPVLPAPRRDATLQPPPLGGAVEDVPPPAPDSTPHDGNSYRAIAPLVTLEFDTGLARFTAQDERRLGRKIRTFARALANWQAQGAAVLPRVRLEVWGGGDLVQGRITLAVERVRESLIEALDELAVEGIDVHQVVPRPQPSAQPADVLGAQADTRNTMAVWLDEDTARSDPRNAPALMDAARLDYPRRVPPDIGNIFGRLTDTATPQQDRLALLAGLPHEHRRWLAADERLVSRLAATLPAQDFAAVAARLIVDVPEGTAASEAARQGLELAAATMMRSPAIASGLLLGGWRFVAVPAARAVDTMRHARMRLAAGRSADTESGTHFEYPPVVYALEEDLTAPPAGGTAFPAADVVREMAVALYPLLSDEQAETVNSAYRAAVLTRPMVSPPERGRPVVPPSLWPDGPDHGIRADGRPTPANRSADDENLFFEQLTLTWLGLNAGTDPSTGLPRNNGATWVRDNLHGDVVKLLTTLYGPGSQGPHPPAPWSPPPQQPAAAASFGWRPAPAVSRPSRIRVDAAVNTLRTFLAADSVEVGKVLRTIERAAAPAESIEQAYAAVSGDTLAEHLARAVESGRMSEEDEEAVLEKLGRILRFQLDAPQHAAAREPQHMAAATWNAVDGRVAASLSGLLRAEGTRSEALSAHLTLQRSAQDDLGPARGLEGAFARRTGRSLAEALSRARAAGRIGPAEQDALLRGLGHEHVFPTDEQPPPPVAVPADFDVRQLPAVAAYTRGIHRALTEGDVDGALDRLQLLDRDLRKVWAVEDAWEALCGEDIRVSLSRAMAAQARDLARYENEDDDEAVGTDTDPAGSGTEPPVHPRAGELGWLLGDTLVPAVPRTLVDDWYDRMELLEFHHYSGATVALPHEHPEDGCYLRAHEIALQVQRWGAEAHKVIVVDHEPSTGRLGVMSANALGATENGPLPIRWRYHIATAVRTLDAHGADAGLVVLDPALGRGALTVDQWTGEVGVRPTDMRTTLRGTDQEIRRQVTEAQARNPGGWHMRDGMPRPRAGFLVIETTADVFFYWGPQATSLKSAEQSYRYRRNPDTLVRYSREAGERAVYRDLRDVLDDEDFWEYSTEDRQELIARTVGGRPIRLGFWQNYPETVDLFRDFIKGHDHPYAARPFT